MALESEDPNDCLSWQSLLRHTAQTHTHTYTTLIKLYYSALRWTQLVFVHAGITEEPD